MLIKLNVLLNENKNKKKYDKYIIEICTLFLKNYQDTLVKSNEYNTSYYIEPKELLNRLYKKINNLFKGIKITLKIKKSEYCILELVMLRMLMLTGDKNTYHRLRHKLKILDNNEQHLDIDKCKGIYNMFNRNNIPLYFCMDNMNNSNEIRRTNVSMRPIIFNEIINECSRRRVHERYHITYQCYHQCQNINCNYKHCMKNISDIKNSSFILNKFYTFYHHIRTNMPNDNFVGCYEYLLGKKKSKLFINFYSMFANLLDIYHNNNILKKIFYDNENFSNYNFCGMFLKFPNHITNNKNIFNKFEININLPISIPLIRLLEHKKLKFDKKGKNKIIKLIYVYYLYSRNIIITNYVINKIICN